MSNITPNSYKLVKESQNKVFQPISTELINQTADEINKNFQSFSKLLEIQDKFADKLSPEQALILSKISRNKRGVFIYLNDRINKLENMTWEFHDNLPETIIEKMGEVDKQYQKQYYINFKKYFKSVLLEVDMDLTKHLKPPVDSCYVSVRAEDDVENFKLNSNSEKIN